MSAEQQYIRSKDVENRASWSQKLLWRLEAIGWDVIYWAPCRMMSPVQSSNFVGWLFKKIGPLTSQHKTATRNLKLAFPDWPDEKIQATAMEAWECFGRTAGELPHLPELRPYTEDNAIEVVNAERLDDLRENGKSAVIISGHFSNWEVMASAVCNRPLDCLITYRALNNPHIDKKLNKLRHDYGIEVLTPKGLGTREMMNALKNHKSVALMNDQKFNQGLAASFFGHDAMTAPGPTRLALKYDVPLIPITAKRTGPAKFVVTIHDPIEIQKTGDQKADIQNTVERINALMEAEVRANPGQWFWMHRRWPKEAWVDAGLI